MTQVHILLTYNPPGGALGHVFAKALGADPKKLLDEELLRFQSLMESGRTTGRQGTVELGNMEVVSVPERREANPEQTSGH